MSVGLTLSVSLGETLLEPPGHATITLLALLVDHLKVVLSPRLIVDCEAVNEVILGKGSRTRTVTVSVSCRPLALVTVK